MYTSLKDELNNLINETNNAVSDIDKNYKLADAEINRRIEIIEGGYALNSDVNSEIERAKNEEKRIDFQNQRSINWGK